VDLVAAEVEVAVVVARRLRVELPLAFEPPGVELRLYRVDIAAFAQEHGSLVQLGTSGVERGIVFFRYRRDTIIAHVRRAPGSQHKRVVRLPFTIAHQIAAV
jgi:hypothetical protein